MMDSKKTLAYRPLDAITYLVNNGSHSNEWAEAGLLYAIEQVVLADASWDWTAEELDHMIEQASNN